MSYEIEKSQWSKCEICNKDISEIKKEFGGNGRYFSYAFKNHIEKEHNLTLENYFVNYKGMEQPICSCGQCGQKVNITIKGAKIFWRTYKCGLFEGTKKWAERAKTERKGARNPMYGKDTWNKGLTAETNEKVRLMAEKNTGRLASEETRAKFRKLRAESPIKARHITPHSEKTKEFLRQNTLNLIKRGVFNQTRSNIQILFAAMLLEQSIEFEEEKQNGYFSFDFYLPKYDLYIEVDGDYWHSNPIRYPDGPKSKTQKINYARDCSKNKFCETNNLNLIRFWEHDITKNKDKVKQELICKLNQLSLSNT